MNVERIQLPTNTLFRHYNSPSIEKETKQTLTDTAVSPEDEKQRQDNQNPHLKDQHANLDKEEEQQTKPKEHELDIVA